MLVLVYSSSYLRLNYSDFTPMAVITIRLTSAPCGHGATIAIGLGRLSSTSSGHGTTVLSWGSGMSIQQYLAMVSVLKRQSIRAMTVALAMTVMITSQRGCWWVVEAPLSFLSSLSTIYQAVYISLPIRGDIQCNVTVIGGGMIIICYSVSFHFFHVRSW